ncbi:MAG TPA: right-handed parallel beta-helix repeat-containing protein [Rhodanobacteraceae bacterium]|nr:right-handed parallel beta-helix repeat-containing protein [Rhodanobacteraceae bacterium]
MHRKTTRSLRTPLALAVALALSVGSAHAASITVTTGGDAGTGTSCTLRQAFESANTDAVVGSCVAGSGADTIAFDAALANATITLGGSQLDVVASSTVTLVGSGQTLDANGASRVLAVGDDASLTASQLILTGGYLTYSGGNPSASSGGAIHVGARGNLSLADTTVRDNVAGVDGGGIYAYEYATVNVLRCTISGNTASDDEGGGINVGYAATLTVSDSVISGNTADSDGGGVYGLNYSAVSIERSTISGNRTNGGEGGGIYVESDSTLTLRDATISGNWSDGDGGGVYVSRDAAATLINTTVTGNHATGYGGGVYAEAAVLTLAGATITGNSSDVDGGGVFLESATYATLVINNTILSGNTAPTDVDFGSRAGGGGYYATTAPTTVTIASSLLGTAMQASYTGNGNVFSDSPGLGALTNNGGLTATMLPQAGSPAIDAGNNALVPSGVSTDQRGTGFARIANGTVDIGAVEVQAAVVPQGPAVAVPSGSPWTLALLGGLLAFFGLRRRARHPV